MKCIQCHSDLAATRLYMNFSVEDWAVILAGLNQLELNRLAIAERNSPILPDINRIRDGIRKALPAETNW